MKKALIIALGVATLTALAGVRPAAATVTCYNVCARVYHDSHGKVTCEAYYKKCTGYTKGAAGEKPIQPPPRGNLRSPN